MYKRFTTTTPRPGRPQPQSLRQASIWSIAKNFEDYFCAGNSALLDDSEQSDVFTPFQYLSDEMIQEIIDKLEKTRLLRPHHFRILLHSNIQCLKLEVSSGIDDQHSVLKTLDTRCLYLTDLKIDMPNQDELGVQHLCTLFSKLHRLTSLDVRCTTMNAELLKVISVNCPNLLHLNGSCCGDGQDLLVLCNSIPYANKLPKLITLSLSGFEKNPSVGVVVPLLYSYRTLRYLRISYSIDYAFEKMYGEEFKYLKKVSPKWINNLVDIEIGKEYGEGSRIILSPFNSLDTATGENFTPSLSEFNRVNLTLQCCPFLTKLSLHILRKPECLKNVSKLKHLTHLCVSVPGFVHHTHQQVKFSTQMLSVLTDIGNNLVSLECSGFYEVRLIIIGKLCQKLESLILLQNEYISEHDLIKDYDINPFPCFTKLKVINISPIIQNPDPLCTHAEELSLLLRNAAEITEIMLACVKGLTDKVISSSHKKHNFRYLKHFHVFKCSRISVKSVWKILFEDSPIVYLRVGDCKQITPDDADLVFNEVKLRRFNIEMVFV